MSEIFKIILSLSLSGSLLILVLFLCKPLIKNRISKSWQYYIWLVVIARLLLPFSPETSFVGTLFQELDRSVVVQTDLVSTTGQGIVPMPQPEKDTVTGVEQGGEFIKSATPPSQAILSVTFQNLWSVWLVVALILLIRKMTIYQGFARYVKAGRAEVSDTAILDQLALIGEQAGVKTPVELYTNSLIASPLLLGFFRPCIVLPTVDVPDSDLQYILLHELTHYKRRDMFYKWLVQLTICLHWFNPLAYLMGREVSRACELACDEAVIRKLDTKGQRDYGDTLLGAIVTGGDYGDSIASMTLNEGKELLKERLEAIMKFKNPSKIVRISTAFLTIAVIFGATFTGAYAAIPDRIASTENAKATQDHVSIDESQAIILQEKVSHSNVVINADNCNVILLKSTDNAFKYDCDKSLYAVTSQSQGDVLTIAANPVVGTTDNTGFMEDTRIRIYIPDATYESVKVVSNHAGISVLPLNTNLDITNNDGALSVYLDKAFNKTLKYTVKGGSGALRLQNGTTNYCLDAMVTKSAFKPAEGMPQYDSGTLPYTYTSGNGSTAIHLNIEDSPFAIETYSGDAIKLLKTHFDIVFLNENNKDVISSKQTTSTENAKETGTVVFDLSSDGQNSIHHSSSFEAKANQTLVLDIQSSISGGTVDLFLFSPTGKEQHITIGGSDKTETVTLTAGRWAYNCTGFFDSGEVAIKGQLSAQESAEISDRTASPGNTKIAKTNTIQNQNGNWNFFSYAYLDGYMIGIGSRAQDNLQNYAQTIQLAVNDSEYVVAFYEQAEMYAKDDKFIKALRVAIADIISQGWRADQPRGNFLIVNLVIADKTADELYGYFCEQGDPIALQSLTPHVKKEVIEKNIAKAYEDNNEMLMMLILTELPNDFVFNADDLARRAISDGRQMMYLHLSRFVSPAVRKELDEKMFGVAGAIPPMPPVPPVDDQHQFNSGVPSIGSTSGDTDTKALDIMQRTGNWGYIETYLPEMTNAGIDAVVNSYNSKHPNSKEHKKASDYYN